jgi:hypothetical protein
LSPFKKTVNFMLLIIGGIVLWKYFISIPTPNDSSFAMDLLRPFAAVFLESFRTPETAVILSMCMAGLCLVNFFWMVLVVFMPLNRLIKTLINEIESADYLNKAHDKLKALDKALGESFFFKERWIKLRRKSFTPNMPMVAGGSQKDYAQNETSPEEYFNLDLLESKGVPLRFLSSLPGYYVGMGLVLTFMGLVASLYFAGNGMKTGDFEEVRSAFVQLLNAATFKFMTSIVGISSSLLLSFSFRICLHRLELTLSLFCHKLEQQMEEIKYPNSIESPLSKAA